MPSIASNTNNTGDKLYVSPNDPDYNLYVMRDHIPDTQKIFILLILIGLMEILIPLININ